MTQKRIIITTAITLISALVIWLTEIVVLKTTATIIMAWIIPGAVLLYLLPLPGLNRLEQITLTIGLSYSLSVLTALVITYTAGLLSTSLLTTILPALSLAFVITAAVVRHWTGKTFSAPLQRLDILYWTVPVGVAAFFSLANLDYADYWGDEMNGILRALAVAQGRPETMFEHTKGPVELIVPAIAGLLGGGFGPLTVRLPFALAHITGISGFYLLVQRMFNRNVSLLATLLLALNGLYISFSRMVQYQAVVFMMTTLSLLLVYHFYQIGTARYVVLGLLLAAMGLLAHYDMLLVLPVIGYLILLRLGWRWSTWKKYIPALTGAGLLFLGVTALFYIPFLWHPHLSQTSSYLNRIIGPTSWPSNSFDELYIFTVLYNSRYYSLLIVLAGGGFLLHQLAAQRAKSFYQNRYSRLIAGGGFTVALLALASGWERGLPLIITLTLLALLLVSNQSVMLKTVFLWTGVAFVGYVFFVDHPRTHLQIIFPGWSILAALGLSRGFSNLQTRWSWLKHKQPFSTTVAVGSLGLLLIFFGYYQSLLFVDTNREYILTYPAHKNPLFWEDPDFPFGSRRLYGAPHRLGWQMITQLFANQSLQGDWYSNDDGSGNNLFWYTLGHPQNPCYPRYYFRTRFIQSPVENLPAYLQADPTETGYVLRGTIWNNDRPEIEVFEFAPLSDPQPPAIWVEPDRYQTYLTPHHFQANPYGPSAPITPESSLIPPPHFAPTANTLQQIAAAYNDPRIIQVKDRIALTGYNLDLNQAVPSGILLITLYWQAVDIINLPYKIFVHLEDANGQIVAQSDQIPACGTRPTNRWPAGIITPDRHILPLPASLPAGTYTLKTGLYEPKTGLRLDLLDSMDNPQGVSFTLPPVTISAQNGQ